MKKLFLLTTALCLTAGLAHAQYYDNSGYDQGYSRQQRYDSQYSRTTTRQAQPARKSSSSVDRQGRRRSVDTSYSRSSRSSSRRARNNRNSRNNKKFYVTPRLGYGMTSGWDTHGVDDAVAPILGVAGGMYLKDFRVEGELAYHMADTIYSNYGGKVEYSQYDFTANGYYDFNLGKLKPFVGAGAGFSKSKVTAKAWGWSSSGTKTGIALSAMGGVAYELTDTIALEGMGRFRYLFRKEDIYNLELIGGVRFSF